LPASNFSSFLNFLPKVQRGHMQAEVAVAVAETARDEVRQQSKAGSGCERHEY
jgi:hypothetical protein